MYRLSGLLAPDVTECDKAGQVKALSDKSCFLILNNIESKIAL